jgi:hypothetical protein
MRRFHQTPTRENAPVLSASEIASYTFCGQAWYLSRRNVARDARGAEHLVEGIGAHRHIGARADRLRAIELVRRFLIIAFCGLATLFVVQLLSAARLALSW